MGLEIDRELIRGTGRTTASVSLASILLPCGRGIALVFHLLRGHPSDKRLGIVLFMGVAISIQAFPAPARILTDRDLRHTPLGALSLCVAVRYLHWAHDIVRPMKVSPSLLPLLRSQMQGDLLALVVLHPEREFSLTELASELGVSHTSVLREVDRLVGGGILRDRRVGRTRLVASRTDTALAAPLAELIAVTYGPLPVLSEALAGFTGVREAYIYGSWAARYNGEQGPPPADVDVLVVGDPDPDALFDLAEDASRRLRREVNVHRVSVEAWAADTNDPFLTGVRMRPLVPLNLDQEA